MPMHVISLKAKPPGDFEDDCISLPFVAQGCQHHCQYAHFSTGVLKVNEKKPHAAALHGAELSV
ncbi:MAG: hypothetical protein OHK0046_21830 [Anaerolineae bacterium]